MIAFRPCCLAFGFVLAGATLAAAQTPAPPAAPQTTGSVNAAADAATIQPRMDVFTADGQRIGRVDRVEGSELKLSADDPQANGISHAIPLDWVARVDPAGVRLNQPTQQVRLRWRTPE